MPTFTFIPRGYLHFDPPITEKFAAKLATDPVAVARHPFLPFVQYDVVTQKIRKVPGGGVELKEPKRRPIACAAHKDAHIFTFYSAILVEHYEAALRAAALHETVTAFRSLGHGRRNIHFANDAFNFIRRQGHCAVLALDISGYFDNIDHAELKSAWSSLLNVPLLPADHYAVYRAITRYCHVPREMLCAALGLNPERPRADGRRRFCSPGKYRELVRGAGLCRVNRSGRGIPQGSPISAVLSNIYLLDFDRKVNEFVTEHGGFYRRYCDDLLVVLPTAALREECLHMIRALFKSLGLEAHPDKTELIDFTKTGDRVTASRTLNYLGFTFDGVHKRIRPASIARYYKKMRSGVARAEMLRLKADRRAGLTEPSPLRCRKLFVLYSYLGRHNFLSYAFDAARIMKDVGIKKQVKPHWKRLRARIERGG